MLAQHLLSELLTKNEQSRIRRPFAEKSPLGRLTYQLGCPNLWVVRLVWHSQQSIERFKKHEGMKGDSGKEKHKGGSQPSQAVLRRAPGY